MANLPKMPKGHSHLLEEKLRTPVKATKKVLTPKQWKFVQELVMGDGQVTMAEAAIRAGWPPKGAKESARLLTNPEKNPHVVAAIQELRKDMAERFGTTMERHMRDLQNIRDLALQAGAYGAAVQAEYRRGQALGTIYIDRKEIRHGTIDSMSKEEVMRKLEEIKRLYGEPKELIDITPAQLAVGTDVKTSKEMAELEAQAAEDDGDDVADELDALVTPAAAIEAPAEPAPPAVKKKLVKDYEYYAAFLSTPEGIKLRNAMKAAKEAKQNVREARERALSEIEGKPTRLPYHPHRVKGKSRNS